MIARISGHAMTFGAGFQGAGTKFGLLQELRKEKTMNELDKLRKMLDEAKIPYENYQEEWNEEMKKIMLAHPYAGDCDVAKYSRNQIIYGRSEGTNYWKIDGICQCGSYGNQQGMIETYGDLGIDADNCPRVMTAEQVFEIIQKDWERKK